MNVRIIDLINGVNNHETMVSFVIIIRIIPLHPRFSAPLASEQKTKARKNYLPM
jgi:hypothetical protein